MLRSLPLAAATLAVAAASAFAATDKPAPPAPAPAVAKKADAAKPRQVQLVGEDAAAVKAGIESKFPGAEVIYVGKSPYFGLYEAVAGDMTVYTDAKVSYLIVGTVIDPVTRQNLSEKRLSKLRAIDWNELPLDLAIKTVKGTGARKMAVFADADCPFCKRLENEMKNIDNVTVYTFLFPIDSLHPDSDRKSKLIWCAPDREKAWKEWILEGKLPKNDANCDTPIEKLAVLGSRYNVKATPTLVYADGHVVPGALPAARIEKEFEEAEAAAKKPVNEAKQ
jgi:thiol:disulfide interchange protein DsbC